MKIWAVHGDLRFPEGIKYSLYAVYGDQILVGYDNHYPKGHHKHIRNEEIEYNFTTLEALKNDFKADVEIELSRRGLI